MIFAKVVTFIGIGLLVSAWVLAAFIPSQANEDFDSYPRDLQRDIRLSTEEGIDLAFAPRREEMYPEGFQTYVNVSSVPGSVTVLPSVIAVPSGPFAGAPVMAAIGTTLVTLIV